MKNSKFNITEALKFGWDTTIKNLLLFLPVTIIILIVVIAYPLTKQQIQPGIISQVFFILFLIISVALQLGMTKICIGKSRGSKMKLADLFSCLTTKKLYQGIMGTIFYYITIIIGYFLALSLASILQWPFLKDIAGLLLIFPGIYFAIKYKFYLYCVLDESKYSKDPLKASAIITENHKWKLLLFYLFIFIINVVGLLAIGIGLLITLPMSMLAEAHVYRSLIE